jgi:integrase
MPRIKRRHVLVNGKRVLTRVWYTWIPDGHGGTRLVSTKCTDKKAAETAAVELERRAIDPQYASSVETKLEQILADYIADRRRRKRADDTIDFVERKAGQLKRILVEEFGAVLTREITHDLLLRYVDARQGENVRNTTIRKELGILRGAWLLARKSRRVSQPIDEIMPEVENDACARTRWLNAWELVAVCASLIQLADPEETDEVRRVHGRAATVAFAVAAGCDFSALWRARREDIAEDFATVHVRGTKRETRDRFVPIPLPEQRSILSWVLEHANGKDGRLFQPWGNIRRDLALACARLGIPRVSPNDLRRSYAKWLRNAGIEPALVGPAMGHRDGRMVERVYGQMTDAELASVMALRLGSRAPTVRLMSGRTGQSETSEAKAGRAKALKKAENSVRGEGIEPPTRGFSIPCSTD